MADDFLSTYAPLANDIATRTGVDPSVVLGIIDTETGHGQHVSGNNIFGISPSGPQGQYVARYPDVQTASQAFVSLMQTPRYAGVAAAGDPASQSAALVKGGYNTVNPKYASIVTNKALNFGEQLGYQDSTSDDTKEGPAVYSTSAQPAATADDSFVPATAPQPPAQAPASTGSAKDRVLSDPALSGGDGSSAAPAQPLAASSAKDRVLSDPALKTTDTTAPQEKPPAPAVPATSAGTVDEYGNVQAPLASAPTPPSPEDIRSKIQQGEINVLQALAPGPDAGPVENFARKAAAVPIHMLAGAAQLPFNALIGLREGPSGGVTWNPETGTYGLTPEAMAAAQLLTGGGPAGRDIRFSGASPLEFVPPTGTFDRKGPIPPDVAANLLTPEAKLSADVARGPVPAAPVTSTGIEPPPPSSAGTQQPAGGTGPQPAGAQVTPGYEAIHTPAEEAAYRATAEGKKLLEPQIIGERDTNQYIPGETVNNAEREQTVKTARELKELGIRVPEASDLDKEAAQSNNTARTIYAENTAKGPVEIANRTTQRNADIEADKKTVFAPDNVTGPVDHAPIVDKIKEVLNKPENRQNDAVQTVLRPLIDRLQEEGGAGKISDPREMWGLRQQIDRWTSKRMQSDDNNLHYAAHELGEVSGVMDQQIEKAAPGYDAMIAKYAEHSRAIDEMTVLQGALKNLRGPGQTLTYNDFQRFMKNVVDSRMTPSTDLNAYKAISPDNMQRLWNIRDSLRRTASAKELARAAGSDTMPNIIDALKGIGKMGGTAALHAYVGAHLGPGGNFALQSLTALGKSLNDRRMIRRATQQMQNLLRPSEPLRVPPGQENPLSGAPTP